jgi:hypothetical protein
MNGCFAPKWLRHEGPEDLFRAAEGSWQLARRMPAMPNLRMTVPDMGMTSSTKADRLPRTSPLVDFADALLSCDDTFAALEAASARLDRTVNPTILEPRSRQVGEERRRLRDESVVAARDLVDRR